MEQDPVVIIGMAARFPQDATSTSNLWQFLLAGRSAHSAIPTDRIGPGYYHPDPEHGGTFAVRGGHFLAENPAAFDAPFFSITEAEALALDPQQRIVLENVYLSLENAGLTMEKVASSNTSVYASGFNHDHLVNWASDMDSKLRYKATGATNSMISNRVSWFFDLKGASVTLDTACSSSMVAFHLACQGLATREADMAIVTGVTLCSAPGDLASMGHIGFLSPDGKSYSFDHRANGYARGEGVGSVVVKRLSDAIRDGNIVRAVVRGTGVNQDGKTPGISTPSSDAQERLIRMVYKEAKLSLNDTGMVEAHGTGTAVGDPIEATAIARTFESAKRKAPIIIGAVKSGIGHLEGAAGVAGIIKSVLVLENAIIPPNVNFEKVNPKIPADEWKILFPQQNMPWPNNRPRRISVNSFGVGGTNGHIILDDAYHYLHDRGVKALHNTASAVPSQKEIDKLHAQVVQETTHSSSTSSENEYVHVASQAEAPVGIPGRWDFETEPHSNNDQAHFPIIVPLTAFDEGGVQRLAGDHTEFLKHQLASTTQRGDELLMRYAYTMSTKRTLFNCRGYVVATNMNDLLTKLARPLRVHVKRQNLPDLSFVFTGQGAQWPSMGLSLMVYPVFRQSLEAASKYMQSQDPSLCLLDEIRQDSSRSRIHDSYVSQPACTAVQIALVDLLASWGIRPSRCTGHSSGEIAAAYCAGRISREAAWMIAQCRGRISSKKGGKQGAMLAVGLAAPELLAYMQAVDERLKGPMNIACYNSPRNCTVAGIEAKIDALQDALTTAGIFSRKLKVQNAYHSELMNDVAPEYGRLLKHMPKGGVESSWNDVEFFSSLTAGQIVEDKLDINYWVENLVQPVRFMHALSELCNSSSSSRNIIVEIGPHGALQGAIKETLAARSAQNSFRQLSMLSRTFPGTDHFLNGIGDLFFEGFSIDWHAMNQWSGSSATNQHPSSDPKMLVDLPGYSFNHSEAPIYQGRIFKNQRLRQHPRHDLFGAPVDDWNPNLPRWKHFLRISEQPWLLDHIVTGSIVFPGVCYMIAAMEAMRQLVEPSRHITSFTLRDISLKRALIVPDTTEGVEISLGLSPVDESSLWASSTWKKFHISSYQPSTELWVEHATGYISAEHDQATGPVDNGREVLEEDHAWGELLQRFTSECDAPLDIGEIYENLKTVGLQFGPLFRNLGNAMHNVQKDGNVIATITVPDVAGAMPAKFTHSHLIHPATMDSMLHLFIASVACNGEGFSAPVVPTFIEEVFVSTDIISEPGHEFIGIGRSQYFAQNSHNADVTVWDMPSRKRCVSMKGLKSQPLDSIGEDTTASKQLCHEVKLTPYDQLLDATAFKDTLRPDPDEDAKYKNRIFEVEIAAILKTIDALTELQQNPPLRLKGHQQNYWDWMHHLKELLEAGQLQWLSFADWQQYQGDQDAKQALFRKVKETGVEGELAMRMGDNIVKWLRDEQDPLDLMFGQDDILTRFYSDGFGSGDLSALQSAYLGIIKDNKTNLSILEVGGGTGGTTGTILDALSNSQNGLVTDSHIQKYVFTDISPSFFEKAQERFKQYRDIMEYKTLDADRDALEQGFLPETFDMIVAYNVLHVTSDLRNTLANMRKLLKPGGKIFLQEAIRQDMGTLNISFGQLEGWWYGKEPFRKWSPYVDAQQWDKILKSTGYSGVDLELPDQRDSSVHITSVMIGTAIQPASMAPSLDEEIIIVTPSLSLDPTESITACAIQSYLKPRPSRIALMRSISNYDLHQSRCIVLDINHPILSQCDEDSYLNVRHLLSTSKSVLWVTSDATANPHNGSILGLIRTVRWERELDDTNLTTLSICDAQISVDQQAKWIAKLFDSEFTSLDNFGSKNGEYSLRGGIMFTNRLVAGSSANEYLSARLNQQNSRMIELQAIQQPIKLASPTPGLLENMKWLVDSDHDQPLAENQVEIENKAVGLNFRDLMIAMGEYKSDSWGIEGAGVVSRVGSSVSTVKLGDRVLYSSISGTFQSFTRADEDLVIPIPDNLGFEIAAGLPCVYATAIYCLTDVAKLQAGETVLIHAAAGGVGQAAIQIAKLAGANIFATVSSIEKRDLLVRECGLREDHIFSSRDLSFVKGILRMTDNVGVDVILNSLSGEALRRSWELLAPFGRFIEIGKRDLLANGKLEMRPFLKAVTMTCVDLVTILRTRPRVVRRLLQETVRLWTNGSIKEAKPTTFLNFEQIESGLRTLQSGKGMGKMVFVPSPQDKVSFVPPRPAPYQLSPNASYVLAGGLGGIGRTAARNMVANGARNLIFLSSSGRITPEVELLLADLEAAKCKVCVYTCDVSDEHRLADVLNECQKNMPPIKGVIQGAMKLVDSLFNNMDWQTFEKAIKPKIQGSWNLHKLLPKDMDFFLMLSSVGGIIGNRSQGNYNVGNVFQDNLSYHRRSLGLPAFSLDLGVIWSMGYVAENRERTMFAKGRTDPVASLTEDEVLTLLDFGMDPRNNTPTQLVTGVANVAVYKQNGVSPPGYLGDPLFTHLTTQLGELFQSAATSSGPSIEVQLGAATTMKSAATVVEKAVCEKLSSQLAIPLPDIDLQQSIVSMGVDSLVAMELRAFFLRTLKADIPLLEITGMDSLKALCHKIATTSTAVTIADVIV